MEKLKILICSNFKMEFEKVIDKDKITIECFNSYCSLCKKGDNMKSIKIENSYLICCKTCPIVKKYKTKSTDRYLIDNMFYLLSDSKIVDKKIYKGGYLISNTWLNDWQENINCLGFNRKGLNAFLKDAIKKVVLFDAFEERDINKLKLLSAYLDLPYEVIPTNLDYLTIFLKDLFTNYELINVNKENNKSLRRISKYQMMINILEQVSKLDSTRELIDRLIELFKKIFGVKSVRFYSINNNKFNNEWVNRLVNDGYIINKHKKCFAFLVGNFDNDIGIFILSGFLFEEHVYEYLEFCVDMLGIIKLSFINIERHDKIIYLGNHDLLTDLYNRNYYEDKVEIINNDLEYKSITIFNFDINKMKDINDSYGHEIGDLLLIRFSEILKRTFRSDDDIMRIGGDEFVVFTKDVDTKSIEVIESKLKKYYEEMKIIKINESKFIKLQFSYGVYTHFKKSNNLIDSLKIADNRMYEMKRNLRKND